MIERPLVLWLVTSGNQDEKLITTRFSLVVFCGLETPLPAFRISQLDCVLVGVLIDSHAPLQLDEGRKQVVPLGGQALAPVDVRVTLGHCDLVFLPLADALQVR